MHVFITCEALAGTACLHWCLHIYGYLCYEVMHCHIICTTQHRNSLRHYYIGCFSFAVLPSQIILTLPFPGEFINVSTQPNCLGGTEALICDRNDTILSDGNLGFDLVPSKFLAWISNSRITIRCGTERCVTAMGLYYYHDPVKEVGLPDFCLSTSQYQSQLGNRLSHVIFWNPTASMTDDTPGVRNVTVVITGPVKENMRYFHIGFMVIGNIHQFAISELYTYNTDGKSLSP